MPRVTVTLALAAGLVCALDWLRRRRARRGARAIKIDGNKVAKEIRAEIKEEVGALEREHGVTPGLAVVLVGARTDSLTYVKHKKKAAAEVGFHSVDVELDERAPQADVLLAIEGLNEDPAVHAILVQLPLPKHVDEATVLKAIAVEKDADGFSALNIGNLCLRGGDAPLALPCTPAGCVELIRRTGTAVAGKDAVVIGRSNIVGMPVAALLQAMDATVTVCHSRTADIRAHVRRADIVIAAVGKAEMVSACPNLNPASPTPNPDPEPEPRQPYPTPTPTPTPNPLTPPALSRPGQRRLAQAGRGRHRRGHQLEARPDQEEGLPALRRRRLRRGRPGKASK